MWVVVLTLYSTVGLLQEKQTENFYYTEKQCSQAIKYIDPFKAYCKEVK